MTLKEWRKKQGISQILEVTKGKVSLQDLYESWWDYEENK
jgi:hypothetical protein